MKAHQGVNGRGVSPGRHVNYPTNTEPGCPTRLLNTGQQRGSGGHSSRKPRPNEVLSTKRWIFDPQRWAARMIYSRSKRLPQKASWKLQQLNGELRSQRSTPLMLRSLTFTWTICDAREHASQEGAFLAKRLQNRTGREVNAHLPCTLVSCRSKSGKFPKIKSPALDELM